MLMLMLSPTYGAGHQVMYTARPEDNYLDAAINATLQVGTVAMVRGIGTGWRDVGRNTISSTRAIW